MKDAVCDAQTDKLFKNRDKDREDQRKDALDAKDRTNRAATKRKRKLLYLIKDCLGLCGTALLVMLTYRYGLYVTIAAVTGCTVAAVCRVMNYLEKAQ